MSFSIDQPRDGAKDPNADNAFSDREAFEKWKADRAESETVEQDKPEPKRYSDVGALARDLDLLLTQHGWTWPERDDDAADDSKTDDSNR